MSRWPDGPGVVEFPDGRRVRGRGLRAGQLNPTHALVPDVGVYLLKKPPPATPWTSVWIRWPDFRLPSDQDDAFAALVEAFDRSTDERVEIACHGGHGRTGSAIAVMAILSGVDPKSVVTWVREAYNPRAVETPWQRRWLRNLDASRIRAAAQ